MLKIKKIIKYIIIVSAVLWAAKNVFHIDTGGMWSAAKTFVTDLAAKAVPGLRGTFDNIDRQVSGTLAERSAGRVIRAKSQKAMKSVSSVYSKVRLAVRRQLRKAGLNIALPQYKPKSYKANKEYGGREIIEQETKANTFVYDKMDIAQSRALRQQFINYSMTLRGVPYVWGGTTPSSGLDCSGFVRYAAKNSIGVQLPRTASQMYASTVRIASSEREPGDLVFFRSFGKVNHVGIYLGRYQGEGALHGRDLFINAASEGPSTGVIISALDEPYWRIHYSSAGRFLPSSRDAAEAVSETQRQ